jgi:hypothetical protein
LFERYVFGVRLEHEIADALLCALASGIGRSRAKLRRARLTAYWRAENVTLRPLPVRRSQTLKPMPGVIDS